MKDIGLKLKDKREENGLSIDEVAEDLKMRPSQISSIEEGKMVDFKDVFYLKYFIRDYAKYLGLNGEAILDEFNEYLFDFTSKISIEDIKKAEKIHIGVIVNDKPVILTGKPEYVFVDIFDHIDFDLSKPQGKSIVTLINGKNASYTQVLSEGDLIVVKWE